ncbi:hypothetical protein QFZ79_002927 [Arthrobacter sp. V4I6]|uniref:DUF6349 family protein n=1 Tax=Arthrobacter sp. V4I6 TaxID=3042281 RepID=UPI0027887C96|nr:DUF6349 family protein [Arthrobacter sp. V4I6]MDQ0854816.1 hypothetical protein [Arthrobacter sp. V4I6]
MSVITGQLDMLCLLEPESPTVDLSSLTGFTFYQADPDALDAINLAWSTAYHSLPHNEWRMFPGWRESQTGRSLGKDNPHPSFMYAADLRCNHFLKATCAYREANPCQCVGKGMVYKAYCTACDWWTPIASGENEAVELQLDHGWPGWRELPVIESKMKSTGGYAFNVPATYPQEWQTPGAPIRECRGMTRYGTRHVPMASPFGGYKTAVVRECGAHHD